MCPGCFGYTRKDAETSAEQTMTRISKLLLSVRSITTKHKQWQDCNGDFYVLLRCIINPEQRLTFRQKKKIKQLKVIISKVLPQLILSQFFQIVYLIEGFFFKSQFQISLPYKFGLSLTQVREWLCKNSLPSLMISDLNFWSSSYEQVENCSTTGQWQMTKYEQFNIGTLPLKMSIFQWTHKDSLKKKNI